MAPIYEMSRANSTRFVRKAPFFSVEALNLLNKLSYRLKSLREKPDDLAISATDSSASKVIPTENIIKMARERLQLYREKGSVCMSMINGPPVANDHDTAVSIEVSEDVELILLLQASAEMVAEQCFDRSRKVLEMTDNFASPAGNPIQRVVHYFAAALKERIDRETGLSRMGESGVKRMKEIDIEHITMQPAVIAIQKALPFAQVSQVAAMQAIIDNLGSAKKVHLVDFGVRNGAHWIILLQALSERAKSPLELIKITAVGTCKERMELTGNWLASFADTMDLPFSFSSVEIDTRDLKKDHFKLESDEAVAVYMDLRLCSLLRWPDDLEKFIGVVKDLNPCIMVTIELEVDTNTSNFTDRFNNTLLLCSALFDCIATCIEENNWNRKVAEALHLRKVIQNIIATEGDERIYRHERMKFWKSCLESCGLQERALSESSSYQANLLIEKSAHWSSCNLQKDGEALILGWKGTPIESISAWSFNCE